MEKALALLEKHVQWLAVGVGVLFLGLMVYWYVIQEPVTVEVTGQGALTPAQLDRAIADLPDAKRLKREIVSTQAPTPPVVESAGDGLKVVVFKPVTPPPYLAPGTGEKPPVIVENGVRPPFTLPIPPAPTWADTDIMLGRGVATWTVIQPPPPTNPGNPGVAPPPPVAFAPPQVEVHDIDYVSAKFYVPMAELAKALVNAGIDPTPTSAVNAANLATPVDPSTLPQNRFQFLGVEVRRQEKLVNGAWGPEVTVATLPPYKLIYKGNETVPVNANDSERYRYAQWAAQNIKTIMQPAFPQIVSGQPWYEPGGTPTAPIQGPMNPIPGTPGVPGAPAIPGIRGGTPIPAGVHNWTPGRQQPQGGDFVGPDAGGPVMLTSAPLGRPPSGYPQGVPPTGGYPQPGAYPPAGYPQPGAVPFNGPVSTPAGPIPGESTPEGLFNPSDVVAQTGANGQSPDVAMFAHDITCEPNKTYRYKMKYWIRNPFWLLSRELKPELRNTFALESGWSPWTKPVTIPARVEVFAKLVEKNSDPMRPEVIQFDVFVTQNNTIKPLVFRASPGDLIASDTATNKWNSGLSVVDVRKQGKSGKAYVILADSNGQLTRRDPETDQADPKLFQLRPPPVGTPGAPGVLPGGLPPEVRPAPGRPGGV